MKKQSKSENLAFEVAFAQLEEIVSRLEAGDLALDEALALFEQGQRLAALCSNKLDEAELKIRQVSASGELEPLDLDEER